MIYTLFLLFVLLAAPAASLAQSSAEEVLPYAINWPTGLGLGGASLTSKKVTTPQGDRWQYELRLDASVPGFPVKDQFRSEAGPGFCSIEFDKTALHGKRKAHEKITFNQKARTATRQTIGGGKSELTTPVCAKDPLAYLFFARQELKAGRIPTAQPVYYGAPYQVRLEFSGTQSIRSGDAMVDADRVVGTVKGPVTEAKFEMLFARDAVRTPLLIKVPFSVGTITMELAR